MEVLAGDSVGMGVAGWWPSEVGMDDGLAWRSCWRADCWEQVGNAWAERLSGAT
jgi:hypothetical protein